VYWFVPLAIFRGRVRNLLHAFAFPLGSRLPAVYSALIAGSNYAAFRTFCVVHFPTMFLDFTMRLLTVSLHNHLPVYPGAQGENKG
jgi:hypothetical protein